MSKLTTMSKSEFDSRKSLTTTRRYFEFDMSNEFIDGEEFEGCDFSYQSFLNTHFSNCTFKDCSFYEASFLACKLTNCDFIDCDLQYSDIKDLVEGIKKEGSNPFISFDNC